MVKDTGIGIKKANQEKIFQAFSQEDNSMTKKFGGTGLGLTISNQLLNLMDSQLQLESEFGIGSCFFFDVEFLSSKNSVKSQNEKNTATTSGKELKNKDQFKNENIPVLIVEDNKINMLLAKTLVKQIIPNSTIFEAVDGQEAIEQFKKTDPSIIFMDIQMPVMNGYEATKEIRKLQKKQIPIIALTAGTVLGEKEKCIEAGMDDYASKPFVKDTLEKIISKWIQL
jgi:CheY-like chemotaxis protein